MNLKKKPIISDQPGQRYGHEKNRPNYNRSPVGHG